MPLVIPPQEIRYTLGKIAILTKRHRCTILYWETRGLIPRGRRIKSSNWRFWTPEEAQKIIDFANGVEDANDVGEANGVEDAKSLENTNVLPQ